MGKEKIRVYVIKGGTFRCKDHFLRIHAFKPAFKPVYYYKLNHFYRYS